MSEDKRKFYWLFTVVAVCLGVFGTYERYKAKAYEQSLEDTYNRAFFELTGYVDDIDSLLAKTMLATDASALATLSNELSVQANSAKACLAQLPISEIQLDKTEKFLSQVGDYTYTLSQSLIDDKTISTAEYENLSSLGTYATSLNNALSELCRQVYDGQVRFGENHRIQLEKTAYAMNEHPLSSVEKEFGEYPSLIYDGPFSEHIENMSPKMLENEREITKQEALDKAQEFLGIDNLEFQSETENTVMESYIFSGRQKGADISIALTKRGGKVVYFLKNRRTFNEKISVETAINKAKAFLSEKGYSDMTNSYYEKTNGVATVNFAYKQASVTCYSDLIKVKVALDDGEIVGMEANGYVMNHERREIITPRLTKQDARQKISPHLSIDAVSLALIPKDSKREVLCYEFKGTSNGRNFLVYINAETGKEEDIQILVESPDGILTI